MLVLIALAYSLLYVRICLLLEASFVNGQGCVLLSAGAFGIYMHRDYEISLGKQLDLFLKKQHRKRRKEKKNPVSAFLFRLARSCLQDNHNGSRIDGLALNVRFGLGSAAETALLAGAVYALFCSLVTGKGNPRACKLRVIPDFDRVCLLADATGIFSLRIGDIMLAALKEALGKRARD